MTERTAATPRLGEPVEETAAGEVGTADATEAPGRSAAPWWCAVPVATLLALYLLATGRWGSYVTIPGAKFYIGDIGIALSAVQVAAAVATRRVSLRVLTRSPLVVLLVAALVVYSAARMAFELHLDIVALRDLAPYAYAVVALLAFLLPTGGERFWRPLVYGALTFHVLWAVVLREVPGYPWDLPVLGTDARILVIRPDFDAAILGVGAALALRELLLGWKRTGLAERAALCLFTLVSTYGLLSISTRAGLLAGLAALIVMAATLPGWISALRRGWSSISTGRKVAVLVAGAIALAVLVVSPAGNRLLNASTSGTNAASGTVSARQEVWGRVGDYVLSSPERTAIGVGFGPDFLTASGSAASLEGIYQNVRSPHNYVVGTLARLGMAGAVLISIIIGLGWWLAGRTLRRRPETITVLAALLAVALPVVAMLGVVLESPFGAICYFWALGQLAASALPVLGTPRTSE